MSTRRQRAASRANAQKSTGPVTAAGKAKSRFNALKHGIDAKQQVMFSESAEDLAELAAEFHELHSPANADERFLVDSMINYEWRLRRLRCVEAGLWLAASKRLLNDRPGATQDSADIFAHSGPVFDRLQRMINSCERHFHRARKELQIAQAARAENETSPQPEASIATSEPPASFRTSTEKAAAPTPNSPPQVPSPTPGPAEEQPGISTGASSHTI